MLDAVKYRWVVGCLLALGGCDRVFGLVGDDDGSPVGDGGPVDGRDEDAAADARKLDGGSGDMNDEDDDGIENFRDPCPADPGETDLDSDSDGIGDRCDPLPVDACTQRLAFYGLETLPPGAAYAGDWTIAAGVLTSAGAAAPNTVTLVVPSLDGVIVRVGLLEVAGANGSFFAVGAAGDSDPGVRCGYGFRGGSAHLDLVETANPAVPLATTQVAVPPRSLRFGVTETKELTCTALTSQGGLDLNHRRSNELSTTKLVLRSHEADVKVDFIDVIDASACAAN